MHTMLIHPNFPSQFGNLAYYLANRPGDKVTFVTSTIPPQDSYPFDIISYSVGGQPIPHAFAGGRTIESLLQHSLGVYECVKSANVKPDVVVGHASYGTWLYLRNLYRDARFVTYFEILPPDYWTDAFDLRPDFPATENARAFNASYHSLTRLLLAYGDAGYTPSFYQLSTCPPEYRNKLQVIHDGVDCDVFARQHLPRPFTFRGVTIEPGQLVVTYLSRGLESFRGFDVFMKVAKLIAEEMPNVVFLVVGGERTVYGHDEWYTDGKTFKQWVLDGDTYPLDQIHFLGLISPNDLTTFFSLSDLHIYLTVPWIPSWSMVQAMACGCTMLVSDTPPMTEFVEHMTNGVRVPFYDHNKIAECATYLLRDKLLSATLGLIAADTVRRKYDLDVCLPRITALLEG